MAWIALQIHDCRWPHGEERAGNAPGVDMPGAAAPGVAGYRG
ncbi:hypothetical protein [Paraburkholderia caffeinilytica]